MIDCQREISGRSPVRRRRGGTPTKLSFELLKSRRISSANVAAWYGDVWHQRVATDGNCRGVTNCFRSWFPKPFSLDTVRILRFLVSRLIQPTVLATLRGQQFLFGLLVHRFEFFV